jgi:hypothetical protein
LTYQWKLNNVNVSGGTSATLALTAVTTNQAGSYTCTVGNSVASVTSSPAILIVNSVPVQLTNHPPVISAIPNQSTPLDTATPAIAFIVGDVETTASDLTLSAVSSNPALIPAANIAFGGSGANRTITLTPVTGQTGGSLITVYVTDGSSTSSTDFQLSVLTSTPSRVTVIINGNGTVVPDLSAATLTIGQTYRISARPGTDQIFAGWTGNVVSSSPTISFVMAPNLVFTANFVPNPYTAVAGQYNGLFYETDEVRQESAGFFDLAVTPRGTYSGNLKTGGSRYKLSGALDLQLRATNRIPRQTGNISVQLRLGANQDAGKVFGQVSDGNWVSPLLGDRAAFNSLNNPAPFASKYTLVIPGQADPSVPAGVGCGTVEIKTSGRVRFAAALADGTKTSQTTAISTGGHWPLYASFYSQRGLLLGWVAFENQIDSDLNGTLCWIKQADPLAKYYVAGFTNECGTIGSMYAPDHSTPTNLVNASRARVAFIGGNLARNLTNSVAIGSDGDGSDDDDDDVSLALSASKGTYSGKMKDPGTGKTFNFQGVVLQKQNVGLGFLLGTNQTSKVVVEPQARRAGDDDDDD